MGIALIWLREGPEILRNHLYRNFVYGKDH